MLWRCVVAVRPAEQRARLVRILESRGLLAEEVENAVQLWESTNREPADFLLVSESVLSRPIEPALESIRQFPEAPAVIVVREEDDAETRARLLGAGCEAVLYTEMTDDAVGEILSACVTRREELLAQTRPGRSAEPLRLGSFRSRSPAMQRVLEVARRVVPAQSSVLILGETGVGKEHLARAIHDQSPRGSAPFVPVNCAAIPETLFESELFGHERGAFTGAVRSHRGFFEIAHGGTVFLDEIGDTPMHVQAKLLRVLEDRKIQRVGAESTVPIDVRLMAATNRDLDRSIRDGSFRADLFYRIGVVSLTIPPLRERADDIPELVRSFLEHFREQIPTHVTGVDDSCMRALISYPWPGNIRELINVIERAILITNEPRLGLADLPDSVRGSAVVAQDPASGASVGSLPLDLTSLDRPLRDARARVVADFERSYLVHQLERAEGRIGVTAKRAGISPRSLFEKMRRHGLKKEDYKP